MPFEDGEAGTDLGVRQASVAAEPDPVAAAVGEPSLGTEGQWTVVGVFGGELQEDLVRRPFRVSPAEDVRFLAEAGGKDFQRFL